MKLIVDEGTDHEQSTLFNSMKSEGSTMYFYKRNAAGNDYKVASIDFENMKYDFISEVLTGRWTYSFEHIKITAGSRQ